MKWLMTIPESPNHKKSWESSHLTNTMPQQSEMGARAGIGAEFLHIPVLIRTSSPIILLRLFPKSSNLALENIPVNQSLLSFSDSMAEIIFKGQPIQFYPLWKTVLFSPNNTLDQPQLPAHVKIFRRQPTGDPGRLLVSSAARRMAPRPRGRWDRSARRSGAWPGIGDGRMARPAAHWMRNGRVDS